MSRGGPYKIRSVNPKKPEKQFQISVPREVALDQPGGTLYEVEVDRNGRIIYTPVMRVRTEKR